jgi:predicted P-loop ATPase/GTPase
MTVETHLVQKCPFFVAIDEVFNLAKLREVLEVHKELDKVETTVLDVAQSSCWQTFLGAVD